MAQYGGDQQKYGREGRHTDEYGNPVRQTDEYGNPVHSTTGGTMGDYASVGHQGLGTNIGHGAGLTGTGHQGLGTGGKRDDYKSSGGYGATGTDTPGGTGAHYDTSNITGGTGAQYGTGHHVTGTDRPGRTGAHYGTGGDTESYQNHPSATPFAGGGIGTGTGAGYEGLGIAGHKQPSATPFAGTGTGTGTGISHDRHGAGEGHEKKGVMEKIKEKLPGVHSSDEHQRVSTTTAGGVGGTGYGEETHEKKGMMEKIKEKLPGHH